MLDALHAGRVAPHRPYLRFVEADALAHPRSQDEIARAIGDRRREQVVVVLDADADDALSAEVLVIEKMRLLDLAAARERDDVAPVLDGVDRSDGGDVLACFESDEIDDRAPLALGAACGIWNTLFT